MVPKDPYIKGKYASFNNAPDTLLSVPAYYAAKAVTGKPSQATLHTLRRCLILPHTGHCRLRKTWYLKRTSQGLTPLPGLTGTLQYMYNDYQCNEKQALLIEAVAQAANVTGLGRGRTSGYGYANTTLKHGKNRHTTINE